MHALDRLRTAAVRCCIAACVAALAAHARAAHALPAHAHATEPRAGAAAHFASAPALADPALATGARTADGDALTRTLQGVVLTSAPLPRAWGGEGAAPPGPAWFIGEIALDHADLGGSARLTLGTAGGDGAVWFNGIQLARPAAGVGTSIIPAEALRAGVNRIAIEAPAPSAAGATAAPAGPGAPAATAAPHAVPLGAPEALLETVGSVWALAGPWWVAPGDHPHVASFDPVMAPDLRARIAPMFVGTRRTKVVPAPRPDASAAPGHDAHGEPLDLWYEAPAGSWNAALPVGNGRMGAMVFGGVGRETIQLNEATVWEGNAQDRNAPAAADAWRRARELATAGRYADAQATIQRTMMLPQDMLPRSYQPLGDLTIELVEAPHRVTGYRRWLALDDATAATTFTLGGTTVTRTVFASAPDELLIVRIAAQPGGTLPAMRVRMQRQPFEADIATHAVVPGTTRARLTLNGQTGQGGVRYVACAEVRPTDGTMTTDANSVVVTDAREIIIAVAGRTSFWGGNPDTAVDADLRAAATQHAHLHARHEEWFNERMRRVELHLGAMTAQSVLPTDERLAAFRRTPGADNDFFALYFRYARYLLLSSSRLGSLPANLQGIWNPHFRAPWNADFHTNINLQMNYWPAGVGALAETELPLFDLLDRMQARGARTAQDLYGAPGWVAHHTTDAWAFTAAEGRTVWGLFPLGGAWLTRHAWEHYLYTGNRDFLERRAFPAMRGAAEFVLAYLTPDPATGQLVCGPSSSPENTFIVPGTSQRADVSMGTSVDQWVVLDLFTNLVDAARVLDLQGDAVVLRVHAALPKVATPRIGRDGRLLEWREPFEEAEPGHRHMSHLFGLHPGTAITVDGSPEYAAAARRSLEARLAHGGGHTGWSRAWLVNLWARLRDGARAYADLCQLLAHSTLPNLFSDHPPFQIDGNFGGAAGIAEMLLQSHGRMWSNGRLVHRVELLPALPGAWEDGDLRGFVARGAATVAMQWRGGMLTTATIESPDGGELRILLPRTVARVAVTVHGQRTIELPVPDGLVVVPATTAHGPRSVELVPVAPPSIGAP